MGTKTVEETIEALRLNAAKLSHILDMQGLVALLAHVLYHYSILESMADKSGFPPFTEDQIFAAILSGMPTVEHVELGSDLSAIDGPVVSLSEDDSESSHAKANSDASSRRNT